MRLQSVELWRCEVDGGSENWNTTFFTFMAYRLPRWTTENDIEQSMQAMSVLSQGMPGLQTDSEESETDEDMPGLQNDSVESETDEEPSEHALEYVRVQFYVMHWEVDGVVVILSVVRPHASVRGGLIHNIALL